jgi:uncharacterized protein (TIGR02646 family)
MKYIDKKPEPQSLTKLKNLKYTDYKPQFHNLPVNVWNDIVNQLLLDQGFLCCFTLDEITPETAILVHFYPMKHFAELELDYRNLYLALRQPDSLPPDYKVGYLAKEDKVIPNYLHDRRCASYFRYNTLGEIIPAGAGNYRTVKKCHDNYRKLSPEQQMVMSTIDILNLNADRLKDQRKIVFNEVMNSARRMSKTQIQKIIGDLQRRDPKTGKYRRFNEVIIHYLESMS